MLSRDIGYQASQPAASSRGPAIPTKRACGTRERTASTSSAPSASPDASPATMPMVIASPPWRIAISALSTDDPASRRLQELRQRGEYRRLDRCGRDRLARLVEREFLPIECLVGAADGEDVARGEPAPAQSLAVGAVRPGRIARAGHERRHI